MSETGLVEFQLAETIQAIEFVVLFLAIGVGALSVKALWCKCKK